MPNTIRIAYDGAAAIVTLRRAEVHNALNPEMIRELDEAFAGFGALPEVRAVVLRAEGKSFCAGGDLNWMREAAGYSFEENVADARRLAAMLKTIHDCPKPVIARVQGPVFGGGVGLVAVCDLVVAAQSVLFSFSEVKLGLVPAVISPFLLRKVPPGVARRYFLTAERFPAEEARRIGLVSEVTASLDELDPLVDTWLRQLQANGPEAIAACKRLLDTGTDWDQALDRTARQLAERRESDEGQEGIRAFLEKRAARWVP